MAKAKKSFCEMKQIKNVVNIVITFLNADKLTVLKIHANKYSICRSLLYYV